MNAAKTLRGQIALVAFVFMSALLALSAALLSYLALYSRGTGQSVNGAEAFALAEGGIDRTVYALNQDANYAGESDTAVGGGTFTTSVMAVDARTRRVVSTGYIPNSGDPTASRTVAATISLDRAASFQYGVQVGGGGATIGNGARVDGSLFSNGNVSGTGGSVTGDASVAGGGNSLSGASMGGNAWADTLSNCTVAGDASYGASTCTIGGTSHPGTVAPAPAAFPVSDAQIAGWESAASAGTVMSGSHTIGSGGSETLGPAKIVGDLVIAGNATVYLAGPVWVVGNVTFSGNAHLIVATPGATGAVLIADATGDTAANGTVSIASTATFVGNGDPASRPMILSTNTGNAISAGNAAGAILYAGSGTVTIAPNGAADAVVARRLVMGNDSTVSYQNWLKNQVFSGGSGGTWAVVPGTYVSW